MLSTCCKRLVWWLAGKGRWCGNLWMALLRALWVSLVPGWGNTLISAAGSLWTIPSMPPLFLSEAEKSTWIWISSAQRGGCGSKGGSCAKCAAAIFELRPLLVYFPPRTSCLVSHILIHTPINGGTHNPSDGWGDFFPESVCCWVAERWTYRSADISALIFCSFQSYCSYRLNVSGLFSADIIGCSSFKKGNILLFKQCRSSLWITPTIFTVSTLNGYSAVISHICKILISYKSLSNFVSISAADSAQITCFLFF